MYPGSSDVEGAVQSALSALNLHMLSTAELKELLNDDGQLEGKIQDLTAIQSFRIKKDTVVCSNKSLAEYNLGLQPKLMELKSKVQHLLEEADQLEQEMREKRDKLSVVDQPLDTTLALLQTAAAQAEEESENLVRSMLDGDMSVENFLELYLPKRRTAVMRRIKVDKLKELVRGQGPGGYRPPASSVPAVPSPYPPAVSAPYPAAGPAAFGGSSPYPNTPYPPAGPAVPYPYMPGMPLPRF